MGETLWERLCARFLGTYTSPLRNPVRFLVFVGGKALQAGGKDLFSLCPWLRILASDGSLGVVISVVCLFPAPTGKTGTPGFGFIGKLRLFFRIFTLDLLERTLAPARCFLPGGISAELVPALLVPEAHTELLRRELSALISGESATLRAGVCTLSPLIAETRGCGCPLSKHSCLFYVPRLVPQEHLVFCSS